MVRVRGCAGASAAECAGGLRMSPPAPAQPPSSCDKPDVPSLIPVPAPAPPPPLIPTIDLAAVVMNFDQNQNQERDENWSRKLE
ncbi:hypothetical protein EVAR_92425_1 [Eumeta japonica]|uniref:Uncharacterized protein n=1 Tax=Eumeta variegata TaxID=151549 RepID=A0A4C1T998_EUMVA|nr:hypothetical protein EVAR_92425_1 [Eumeta japonica]